MSLSFSQVHLFFLHLRSLAMLQRRRTTLWQVIGATLNTTFQPGQAKIMTTAEETPRHSVASMNTARRWVAVLSDDLYWSSDYITYNYIYIYMSLYVYSNIEILYLVLCMLYWFHGVIKHRIYKPFSHIISMTTISVLRFQQWHLFTKR